MSGSIPRSTGLATLILALRIVPLSSLLIGGRSWHGSSADTNLPTSAARAQKSIPMSTGPATLILALRLMPPLRTPKQLAVFFFINVAGEQRLPNPNHAI
jgi:hypothetical protein